MKKLIVNIFILLLLSNLCIAQDRNFVPVATVNGELYLLDFNSIKPGDNNEIKYIQLISFKKKQTTENGKKYLSVQMYMKGKCNDMINKPYILQYYDAQMDDGNVMKGNIVRSAKARAFTEGRGYVTPEDVRYIGHDVLRHRIILTYEAEAEELNSDLVIDRLFEKIEVP